MITPTNYAEGTYQARSPSLMVHHIMNLFSVLVLMDLFSWQM